ncbi:hypothetical protein ECZU29_47690 [Escherichia coli]|nr:hypothetical protein ECZU29_47690 [Escherichia coli]
MWATAVAILRAMNSESALSPQDTPTVIRATRLPVPCFSGRRAHHDGGDRLDGYMLAVDLTPCPQAGIGTPVELWGKEIKIDDVAAAAGTVGYELMCALALRVPVVTV